ncbi:dihydroorotase [Streptomyces nigra]|uniref:dihydroorotase n=1 Tax=Streptomyces nigra TaxID=1827580 RepID=UPI0036C1D632
MTAPTARPVAAHLGALGTALLTGVRILGGTPTNMLIHDGVITALTPSDDAPRTTCRIDSEGLVMLPAFVDLHTHLREPGDEDSETIASGTLAAAAGGYSDVFAMANCDPVTDTPERVAHIARTAAAGGACRVHPVGAVTQALAGRRPAPLAAMARAGARLFSDDGHCVDDPALLRGALQQALTAGAVVAQHAQCASIAGDGQINAGTAARTTGLAPWPPAAEESIIARDVVLAGETGAPLHICHLSTAGSVEIVRWAKARGWPVTAEAAPHHLLLDDTSAATGDTLFKVNPPLRGAADVTALRAALTDGTIDAVATDHAPHPAHRKAADWCHAPFGMLGLETALAVVADVLDSPRGPDWPLVAQLMAHRPARIGGIDAFAGRPLAVGEPATFTLVDPQADWTVVPDESHSLSRNTPYRARTFRHRPVATVVTGRVTADRTGLLAPAAAASQSHAHR